MKKTPRDLLFAQYAAASPQLDHLRRDALADATPIPARQLLHAIFYPQRRLWFGLAAAWLVIISLHFSQRPTTTPRSNTSTALYAAHWSANQAQLHALLSTTSSYR
jgi:hypothetical protein